MLPKMNGHTKGFNQTKYMSFFIKRDKLQKNTIKSWIKSAVV